MPSRPTWVHYATIFASADLYEFINASPSEIYAVLIAIVGYVQTILSSPVTMAKWIPFATWKPVPGLVQLQ